MTEPEEPNDNHEALDDEAYDADAGAGDGGGPDLPDAGVAIPGVGGRVEPVGLDVEMQRSYLDYAMSVIVGRALPDVRDGLKPVHRKILYAMFDAGFRPDRGYVKCARIVGDVMGNYHPHGDSAIYDTLVRMAQSWSLRYPLIDGNGNFGSPGNDPAAAMRYTESRLAQLAMEMLRDIDGSRTCSSMVPMASPSASPRRSRRTTCARSRRRCSGASNTRTRTTRPRWTN